MYFFSGIIKMLKGETKENKMKRKYWKHENIDTTKPFMRFIDDMYNFNYSNIDEDGNQLDGAYFKTTEGEAWQIEELPEFKGVKWFC